MAAFLTAVSACAKPLAVIAVLTAIALWLRKYSEPNLPADDDLMAIVDAVLAGPDGDDLLEPHTWTTEEIQRTARIHLMAAIRAEKWSRADWEAWNAETQDVR